MVNKELSEAITELNEIFNNTSNDVLEKIPKSFLQFVNENVLDTYEFEYDKTKSLKEQNLKPKTKGLIALVYRDFLCDYYEKQKYNEKVLNIIKEIELEKREKYNPDAIFEKPKSIYIPDLKQKEIIEETSLINKQDDLFTKLLKKIKNFFTNLRE